MSTILTISGSARKDSFNTKLLNAFHAHAPEGVTMEHIDWSALPLYNQDLESDFPESVLAIKEKIRAADGIIISTPEYNRSIPAPLKNVLDWTSRPYGESAWTGKKVYVVGATVAPTGTTLAQADVRKVLLYLGAHVPGQPEFYLSNAYALFDDKGSLTDESTNEHVKTSLAAFVAML